MLVSWPIYTCTLTFIFHVLKDNQVQVDIHELAKFLKIQVPKGSINPFGYPETDFEKELGISMENVTIGYTQILDRFLPGFTFTHVPLNLIPYGMYQELIGATLKSEVALGIGYNFGHLDSASNISKHVSFITRINSTQIILLDYYEQMEGSLLTIPYDKLIRAASQVSGGFWMIGEKEEVNKILNEQGI